MSLHHLSVRSGPFEASSTARKVDDWDTYSYGPNAVTDDIEAARARSQDAVRNNPWIRKAIKLASGHEVGCGLTPNPSIENSTLKTGLLKLWNRWVKQSDADGVLDFYGLQLLASKARRTSGEVFARFCYRSPADGLVVPLQLQLLEADLLPIGKNELSKNGSRIRQGIELNATGQRVAYHFYQQHPGDSYALISGNSTIRTLAKDVLHYCRPERPGQLRGEPEPISALVRARNLDEFESAELTRKKIRAKFVGALGRDNTDENPFTGFTSSKLTTLNAQLSAAQAAGDDALVADLEAQIEEETDKRNIVDIDEGFMLQLALNETATFNNPDNGDGGLEFIKFQQRSIAAGINVPYELMSGDFSAVNDRIMRVLLNAFYRDLEADQDLMENQLLQPVWCRFLDVAVLSNAITIPGYIQNPHEFQQCEWRAHAWSYVNPLQEVQTTILKINNGLTSRTAAVAESGWDAEAVDQQQSADRQREESLGLSYGAAASQQQASSAQ